MSGQFWCEVKEEERGRVPVVRVAYTPVLCGHCDECPLIAAAPGCVRRNDDGFVVIDPAAAAGRSDLVDLCPYGRVYYNAELGIPQKCTGCAHLLDNGWDEPRCVDACMTDALLWVDEADIPENAEKLSEGSHVYYVNFPKRFIGATVVDYAADEVVIGARVMLKDAQGAVVAQTETDDFGDFIFKQVDAASFTVEIAKDGYESQSIAVNTENADVNLNFIDFKPVA